MTGQKRVTMNCFRENSILIKDGLSVEISLQIQEVIKDGKLFRCFSGLFQGDKI